MDVQHLGVEPERRDLLRLAVQQGCTVKTGSHGIMVYTPDGHKIGSTPSSKAKSYSAVTLRNKLQKAGIETDPRKLKEDRKVERRQAMTDLDGLTKQVAQAPTTVVTEDSPEPVSGTVELTDKMFDTWDAIHANPGGRAARYESALGLETATTTFHNRVKHLMDMGVVIREGTRGNFTFHVNQDVAVVRSLTGRMTQNGTPSASPVRTRTYGDTPEQRIRQALKDIRKYATLMGQAAIAVETDLTAILETEIDQKRRLDALEKKISGLVDSL